MACLPWSGYAGYDQRKDRDGFEGAGNRWRSHGTHGTHGTGDVVAPSFLWYPLVMTHVTMENHHLWWIVPLKIMIFHSYVKLAEGILSVVRSGCG